MDSNNQGAPIQTIRVADKEKEKLVWAVNNTPNLDVGANEDCLCVTPVNTDAVLTLAEKGSEPIGFVVMMYGCGRNEVRLIHGRYIHPETPCRVRFRSLNGDWHERTGVTGKCVHVTKMIHAVLVVFEEAINLDDFAQLNAEEETRHLYEIAQELPNNDAESFDGLVSRILFVDDQPSDRKLINYWLSHAGMDVCTVATADAAKQQVEANSYDLLIVDMMLGADRGSDLIKDVRRGRFVQPILAVSADDTESMRESALGAGANSFLPKPLEEAELVSVAQGLLGFDADEDFDPIYSQFNHDSEMLPLLTGYARSLPAVIGKLRKANSRNDYESILAIANSLKGCGAGYGFPDITSTASLVLAALDADIPDIDEIKRLTTSLVVTLSRIKVKKLDSDPEVVSDEELV